MLPNSRQDKSRFEGTNKEGLGDTLGSLAARFQSNSASHKLLSPQRQELLANCQYGVLSPSTPPLSRQRRHSKMHLRIASELSVDQGECSSYGSSTDTIGGGATTAPTKMKERYRIVILGSSAVGKTAICEQFLYGSFPEKHCATVEELHKGEYEISGGGFVPLELLDTSGSFEFPAMRRLAISTGDAFALVYSIDQPDTFEEVKNIREMIMQVKGSETMPPIVVVGNKSDLPDEKRQVKKEMAELLTMDWGDDFGFVEVSAKENKNVVNIFSCLLLQTRLKGLLNVAEISSYNSTRVGYKEHSEISRAKQRRRSSLPISELFHRLPGSRSETQPPPGRTGTTFRKRNSCTPS